MTSIQSTLATPSKPDCVYCRGLPPIVLYIDCVVLQGAPPYCAIIIDCVVLQGVAEATEQVDMEHSETKRSTDVYNKQ